MSDDQLSAAVLERRVEWEGEVTEGHNITSRMAVGVQLGVLHEAEVSDVVRRPVAPHDDTIAVRRDLFGTVQDGIEAQHPAGSAFAEHPEASRQSVGERETRACVSGDGEADGG